MVAGVFLASFPTGWWQANCYLVGAADSSECVIIDAGQDAVAVVNRVLAEQGRTPVGILLTHGHFDHVADAGVLAREHDIPVWIHPADAHLLTDPGAGLGADGSLLVQQLLPAGMVAPPRLESLEVGAVELAGLGFGVSHAPGHTAGSVLFNLPYSGDPQIEQIVFSGDVLFASSIGRTDLPGGDPAAMNHTLRTVVLGLADRSAVLPGHGEQTNMAHERAHNPYLQPDFLRN